MKLNSERFSAEPLSDCLGRLMGRLSLSIITTHITVRFQSKGQVEIIFFNNQQSLLELLKL